MDKQQNETAPAETWEGPTGGAYWVDPTDPTQSARMIDTFSRWVAHNAAAWADIMDAASTADYTVQMEQTGGGVMCMEIVPTEQALAEFVRAEWITAYIGGFAAEPETEAMHTEHDELGASVYDNERGVHVYEASPWEGDTVASLSEWVRDTAREMYAALVGHVERLQS
jgi:hypothetical protein